MNCYGHSSHDIGLRAEITINCSGDSPAADGLVAIFAATNCYGHSSGNTSTGLNVNGTANACGGGNDNGGFAIKAAIGIGCGNFGGTTSITNKYLAP
jgi:hypothetical protein